MLGHDCKSESLEVRVSEMKSLQPAKRRRTGKILGILSATAALVPFATRSTAQEGLQSAVAEDRGYRERRAPLERPQDYHTQGHLTYAASLNYDVEFRDNVFSADNNKQSDFIHRPFLDLRALWKATKGSSLQFGAGIGYTKYTRFTDQDRLNVSPKTTIAWDIPVKDFLLTVYDRVSYSEDVLSQAVVSGVAAFPRLENTAGLRATWSPDRYQFQLGYGHQNFHSSSAQFSYVNRSSETVFGRAAYRFHPSTLAGVEGSAAFTDYSQNIQANNQSFSAGPYVEWQLTRYMDLSLRGGMVHYTFDPTPSSPGPISDLNSYYAGAEIRHRLTQNIRQSLTLDKKVQQGLNQGGRYIASTELAYDASWQINNKFGLTVDGRFEDGKESAVTADESYQRMGGGLGIRYQLTRRLSPALRYAYLKRTSNTAGRGYEVNSVTLSLSYQF
jgi:Putative beta-barrel porin 2